MSEVLEKALQEYIASIYPSEAKLLPGIRLRDREHEESFKAGVRWLLEQARKKSNSGYEEAEGIPLVDCNELEKFLPPPPDLEKENEK